MLAHLRRLLNRVHQATMVLAAYPIAVLGSCLALCVEPLRRIIAGADPNLGSHRHAVYAIYDKHGLIADYVVEQVKALAQIGYRVIVVSTSRQLPEAEATRLLPHCCKLVHRRNMGHDFGSYKAGLGQIADLPEAESLILMNDSCYGPLFDLGRVERQALESGADVWGITDSWLKAYHLQSYYLRLNNRAINSTAFRRFWRRLLPYQSRSLVVRHGEVGFTQCLLRNGLTAAVLCPYHRVAAKALQLILERISREDAGLLPAERIYLERLAEAISKGAKLNPTHPFWDVLIVEYSCPFIKRELLRSNPEGIRGVIGWPSLVATYTDYDTDLIHRHLSIR